MLYILSFFVLFSCSTLDLNNMNETKTITLKLKEQKTIEDNLLITFTMYGHEVNEPPPFEERILQPQYIGFYFLEISDGKKTESLQFNEYEKTPKTWGEYLIKIDGHNEKIKPSEITFEIQKTN